MLNVNPNADGLFPTPLFSVSSSSALCGDAMLHDAEKPLVAAALDKRQAEFATGRACARRALQSLAGQPTSAQPAILKDAVGAPVWPAGIVGSISHTKGLTAAVAARTRVAHGVGIDVEYRRRAFPAAMLDALFVLPELRWLKTSGDGDETLRSFALFSAKESIYKCVCAASGDRLGFHNVAITMDLRGGVFIARFLLPVGGAVPAPLHGRVAVTGRHVMTGVWWPALTVQRKVS